MRDLGDGRGQVLPIHPTKQGAADGQQRYYLYPDPSTIQSLYIDQWLHLYFLFNGHSSPEGEVGYICASQPLVRGTMCSCS